MNSELLTENLYTIEVGIARVFIIGLFFSSLSLFFSLSLSQLHFLFLFLFLFLFPFLFLFLCLFLSFSLSLCLSVSLSPFLPQKFRINDFLLSAKGLLLTPPYLTVLAKSKLMFIRVQNLYLFEVL